MAELPRSVIIDPAVLAARRARRAAGPAEAPPAPPRPFAGGPPSAGDGPAWTAPPRPPGRLVAAEQLWRERREALERELASAAQALTRVREDERAAREAVYAALESARAELRAVRAARAADQSALATLTAELEAERIAHAVARAEAARLRAELADPPAVVADDLTPPDLFRRRPEPGGLAAAAQAQVAAAAAAERRPAADLVADLDAAAKTLRGGAADRHLRRALVALAREDPYTAGRWLVSLLPAQAAVLEDPPSYDLTIRGLGTYAVTGADVRRIPRARPRDQAHFHLRADAAALAGLLAGDPLPVRRFRRRGRKHVAALKPVAETQLSLAEALRAGARLEPRLVFAALPYAIDPEWTRGHTFTVAQEITERLPRTWYVTARDGERLAVSETAPGPPDATVAMSRRAFDALLRGDPCADLPTVRGDRVAVAALKAWTDRARG